MAWRSYDAPEHPALALLELSSIARGIHATDAMLKAADVELVITRSICSGKYMVLVSGSLEDCEASLAAGLDVARECEVDSVLLPNVHPDVFPAVSSTSVLERKGAIGILEAFTVASLVEALDAVAKEADVSTVECRLAMALGGKAYLVFSGDVDSVGYSLEAGAVPIERRGLLVNKVVIPDPVPELFQTLI